MSPLKGEESVALKTLAKIARTSPQTLMRAEARGELTFFTRGGQPRGKGVRLFGYESEVRKWMDGGVVLLLVLVVGAVLCYAHVWCPSEAFHDSIQRVE